MKRLPIAVGLMVFGLFWVILGTANGWAAVATIAGLMVIAGFVWFCLIWEKVMKLLTPLRGYDKRVRRLEERFKTKDAYRDLKEKTVDHEIANLKKTKSQNIKSQVIYMSRKEA